MSATKPNSLARTTRRSMASLSESERAATFFDGLDHRGNPIHAGEGLDPQPRTQPTRMAKAAAGAATPSAGDGAKKEAASSEGKKKPLEGEAVGSPARKRQAMAEAKKQDAEAPEESEEEAALSASKAEATAAIQTRARARAPPGALQTNLMILEGKAKKKATTPRKGAKEESNDDGDEAGPSTQATNQSLPKREVAKAGGKKAKAASASDPRFHPYGITIAGKSVMVKHLESEGKVFNEKLPSRLKYTVFTSAQTNEHWTNVPVNKKTGMQPLDSLPTDLKWQPDQCVYGAYLRGSGNVAKALTIEDMSKATTHSGGKLMLILSTSFGDSGVSKVNDLQDTILWCSDGRYYSITEVLTDDEMDEGSLVKIEECELDEGAENKLWVKGINVFEDNNVANEYTAAQFTELYPQLMWGSN